MTTFAPMEPVTTQYELRLAERMSRLGTETAFEVLNKARALERQGKSIIHLEIGEPDFDTPKNIVESAVNALHKGWTHYGPSAGLPDLRQAIAEEVSASRGVEGYCGRSGCCSWRQADHFLHDSGIDVMKGTRSSIPIPASRFTSQ